MAEMTTDREEHCEVRACGVCESNVTTAPATPRPIDGARPGPCPPGAARPRRPRPPRDRGELPLVAGSSHCGHAVGELSAPPSSSTATIAPAGGDYEAATTGRLRSGCRAIRMDAHTAEGGTERALEIAAEVGR